MRLTNPEIKLKLSDTKRYDLQDHKMFEKLKELEDIEEELGIDLIILFKLFKYPRIWAYSNSGKVEVYLNNIDICEKTITLWNGVCRIVYPFSEYKKSWAFTKEELYD